MKKFNFQMEIVIYNNKINIYLLIKVSIFVKNYNKIYK